jgi:poly-beta-1,6-N-acetyl-D-glucosamine synthase
VPSSPRLLHVAVLAAAAHVGITWWRWVDRGARRRVAPRASVPPVASPPSVSVLVPAWNERSTVERCIRSLCLVDDGTFETVVAAGGPDGTYEAAVKACRELPRSTVIEQRPGGKNAALNDALRIARGEIIVILDADSEVASGWLPALVAPIGEAVVATTGRPLPYRSTFVTRVEQMEQVWARHVDGVTTLNGAGSIAIARSTINDLGGFAEDVRVGVDWDLDARLAAADLGREYCAEAIVHTERPATLGEYWTNEVRWRRAHLASLFRHPGHFLANPVQAMSALYVYVLAWATVSFSLLVAALLVTGPRTSRGLALRAWGLLVAWLGLRRAGLALGVAAFTRDRTWLAQVWAPPLLLALTFGAIIRATLTIGRATEQFKGPRPGRSAPATVDPHGNEIRYALAQAGQVVAGAQPITVRIASRSPEVVRAAVRQLSACDYRLVLETEELRQSVADWFGLTAEVRGERATPADVALLPFSLEEGMRPAGEATVVAVCHNALSHRGLLGRGGPGGTVFQKLAILDQTYDTRAVSGILSPLSIALFGLANLLERWSSSLHFRVEDLARQRIVEPGPLWRVSSVVIIAGRRRLD